jgi:hypothetical protein
MNLTTTRRWADNDSHFGPFTWSKDNSKKFGLVLDSGANENPGCHLRAYFGTRTLLMELPPLVRPWRKWVDLSKATWATSSGYWDEHPNEYGVQVSDGFLQVFLGPQTGDSTTTRDWCYFLPWTQWQSHRISLYDTAGQHYWTQLDSDRKRGVDKYKEQTTAEENCPSVSFEFLDFDGEQITVRTHIEEREWRFGTGWFQWLRWFRSAKIARCLDLEFSKEIGPRKGSWKGGTIGHSIELLPGELHHAAFLRYCAKHNMTLLHGIS